MKHAPLLMFCGLVALFGSPQAAGAQDEDDVYVYVVCSGLITDAAGNRAHVDLNIGRYRLFDEYRQAATFRGQPAVLVSQLTTDRRIDTNAIEIATLEVDLRRPNTDQFFESRRQEVRRLENWSTRGVLPPAEKLVGTSQLNLIFGDRSVDLAGPRDAARAFHTRLYNGDSVDLSYSVTEAGVTTFTTLLRPSFRGRQPYRDWARQTARQHAATFRSSRRCPIPPRRPTWQ
jgi:hypothetical protein